MPQGLLALCLSLMLVLISGHAPVWADEDDTRYLLQEQTRRAAERAAGPQGELFAPPGSLVVDGRVQAVQSRQEELEPAIYIAINSGQWERLPEFLSRYRLLHGHRPALVAMAEALLARHQGDYAAALRRMQAAHAADPADARINLELARLRFEDNQDGAAGEGFARAMAAGLPGQVQAMVRQYQQALAERARWHGSLALGWGYNNNINQGSGDYACFLELGGMCFFERRMPQPIHSSLLNYELALQRRWNLGGNHNLQLRPVSYGSHYSRKDGTGSSPISDHGSRTSILYGGYQWLDARTTASVTPYLEHFHRNGHTEYVARGMQLEWQRMVGSGLRLGTSLDAKRYAHTGRGLLVSGSDYSQYQWGVSAVYVPQPNTVLNVGADVTRKKYAVPQASSRDWAFRGGIYHQFAGTAGLFVNVMGVFRFGRNDAYDGFLGAQRRDRQQVYILGIGANAWKLAGMTPELRLRHSANRSNVSWAYGFRQTELGVMLRRNF
ncbi:uncharacterized protein DUF560 [Corticibacter populi]|nr:uncharacterized protein DUF560 [Corticibacter populi]